MTRTRFESLVAKVKLPPTHVTLDLGLATTQAVILPPALFDAIVAYLLLEADGFPSTPEIAERLLARLQVLKA